MSKFKVGDKVRVIEHMVLGETLFMEDRIAHNSFVPDMMRLAEQVVTISAIEMDWSGMEYRIEEDGGEWFWVDEMFSGLAIEPREFIVVRRSGSEVIASHKRGDEIVKTAKATCAPSDEFNFDTGAKLAFDRLVGREEPKPKTAAPAPKFKVGDRVVTQFGNGTVVEINYQHELIAYTVEHDNTSDMLHSGRWDILNGPGFSPNRCYFFSEHDLSPAPEPKYYTGKVFAVRAGSRFRSNQGTESRNGHVFEIKDGRLVKDYSEYGVTNNFPPFESFSDFCESYYCTEWAEVKD